MKKIIAAALAAFIIIFMADCAQPKQTNEARVAGIKAKLYNVERNISRMEAELFNKAAFTKAAKDANALLKKTIESDKMELMEIQEKLENTASLSGAAMQDFILEVELSADSLAGRAFDGPE